MIIDNNYINLDEFTRSGTQVYSFVYVQFTLLLYSRREKNNHGRIKKGFSFRSGANQNI